MFCFVEDNTIISGI